MAEFALTALASLGGGAGLAGTAASGISGAAALAAPAAAGWVGAGTAATGLSSNVLNILSGVATAASVLGTLNSGFESARQATEAANEAEIDAGQSQLQSLQRQNSMKRELFRVLGENAVSIAAAGIDVSGGLAQQQAQEATQTATRELSIERNDDELRRARFRARALGLRRAAGSQIGGALLRAAGQGASYGIDLVNRG